MFLIKLNKTAVQSSTGELLNSELRNGQSKLHQLGPRCKLPPIMNLDLFSSFSNTSMIVWLNDFSQNSLNVIILFKYYIETMILFSKSIV